MLQYICSNDRLISLINLSQKILRISVICFYYYLNTRYDTLKLYMLD